MGGLDLGASTLLAAALSQHGAQAVGVRSLLIKGQQLTRHRLRAHRTSSDVDALVDPAGFDRFCEGLARGGWVERPRWRLSDDMTTHSISLLHPEWPCDIDVHRAFPGFLAPPDQVFDALWARRTTMLFAGIECNVPDRASSALILALHSLRSSPDEVRHLNEYNDLVARLLAEDDDDFRRELTDVAAATGAAGTSEPLLRAVGAEVPPFDRDDPALIAWVAHVNAGNDVTAVFAERWRETPWSKRPRMLALALWPSNSELRLAQPDRELGTAALMGARFSRLGRAVIALPRALGARRRASHGEWDSPYVRVDQ